MQRQNINGILSFDNVENLWRVLAFSEANIPSIKCV